MGIIAAASSTPFMATGQSYDLAWLLLQEWQDLMPNGASKADVGGIVVGSTPNLVPTLIAINGTACSASK